MKKPTTLNECFLFLDKTLPQSTIELLKELRYDELYQVQFKLCPVIQKEILDENEELERRFENSAFCDASGMAERILAAYWDHVQITGSRGITE